MTTEFLQQVREFVACGNSDFLANTILSHARKGLDDEVRVAVDYVRAHWTRDDFKRFLTSISRLYRLPHQAVLGQWHSLNHDDMVAWFDAEYARTEYALCTTLLTMCSRVAAYEKIYTAYIECALWSSTDENDDPLDRNYDETSISSETAAWIVKDCISFYDAMEAHITHRYTRAGHDFWLTRNGHGAGFWDGDWEEPAASILTQYSKAQGEVSLYVGDDGEIYIV